MSMAIKVARVQSQGSGRVMPGIGDPGLFGFVGNVFKKATGLIPGPIGDISRKIFGGQTVVPGPPPIPTTFFQATPQAGPPSPIDRIRTAAQALTPGGVEPFGMAVNGMGCATGHHPNKSDYFLKDGTFIQKGTRCVKNRRRNPLNARAADRAISRIESAKRATKRLSRVTVRKSCS